MKNEYKRTPFSLFGRAAPLFWLVCFFSAWWAFGENSPGPMPIIKAEAGSIPVIMGQRFPVSIIINNPTRDLLVIDSIYTDRGADEPIKGLQSQYGRVFKDESGRVIYDNMAQMASREVFFNSGAVIPPGGMGAFVLDTRFFGQPRTIIAAYYRIPADSVGDYIYKPQKDSPFDNISYLPLTSVDELVNSADVFIFLKNTQSTFAETRVSLTPPLREPLFNLQSAMKMLPRNPSIREVSFSDTFSAWIFQEGSSTWLVNRGGAERFGGIESLVFEKIDSANGQNITFRVPEELFAGKFTLEQGDGMYRVGTFLTVSGPEILDVFRILRDKGLGCRVFNYFFSSYFIDTGKPQR
jgi:hypothetical protein